MKFISVFLLQQLFLIHTGTLAVKIKASFYLSAVISPFALIMQKLLDWYVDNHVYIFWVCGAILVDWFVGVWKHLQFKSFSWFEMGKGILLKLGMAMFAGFLFEALPFFLKEDNIVSDSLLVITRLSVFMYPAGSAWMNMSVITNGVFPPIGWIKRIKYFQENLNINDLKETRNE